MNKQINFYSTQNDEAVIANTLRSVFGQLLIIPYYKGDFSVFDKSTNEQRLYLTESCQQQHIVYRIHKYYDNTTTEVLDYRKSPVLEYSVPFQREDMVYISGRFYCCSDNIEFSKKVSKFFGKLKKEFQYIKQWKCYISNSIDIEASRFLNEENLK